VIRTRQAKKIVEIRGDLWYCVGLEEFGVGRSRECACNKVSGFEVQQRRHWSLREQAKQGERLIGICFFRVFLEEGEEEKKGARKRVETLKPSMHSN